MSKMGTSIDIEYGCCDIEWFGTLSYAPTEMPKYDGVHEYHWRLSGMIL